MCVALEEMTHVDDRVLSLATLSLVGGIIPGLSWQVNDSATIHERSPPPLRWNGNYVLLQALNSTMLLPHYNTMWCLCTWIGDWGQAEYFNSYTATRPSLSFLHSTSRRVVCSCQAPDPMCQRMFVKWHIIAILRCISRVQIKQAHTFVENLYRAQEHHGNLPTSLDSQITKENADDDYDSFLACIMWMADSFWLEE